MNLIVHQNIIIHTIKIEAISNSSVLQIGSAGMIKPVSNLANTGGFTEPAPKPGLEPGTVEYIPLTQPTTPFTGVQLSPPGI